MENKISSQNGELVGSRSASNGEKTYTFYVKGMHCASCVVLTESELSEVSGISRVKASLDKLSVEVTGNFGEKNTEEVAHDLSEVMKPHGYSLLVEAEAPKVQWVDFKIAIPAALAFIAVFIALQKLGIVNLVTTSDVGYGTAFVIGLIASVSTCMAVVGGLVLSMSANFARGGDKIRPQLMFHGGRMVSFFILGGVIGALGSAFQLGIAGTVVLNLVLALVLLVLGLNLLDVFPWMKRIQPTLPGFLGKRVHELKRVNHVLTPSLVGVATFFLPCGFTQSMQFYTLTTGNFWTGALTMFVFALGTLPVLLLLSFSSAGIMEKPWRGAFFKAAGLIVVFFALFNLLNILAAAGVIPPIFNL
ncbi:MAG: sulfite exporter TauE/SafE family protein [Patescibacteria group bacterium]